MLKFDRGLSLFNFGIKNFEFDVVESLETFLSIWYLVNSCKFEKDGKSEFEIESYLPLM